MLAACKAALSGLVVVASAVACWRCVAIRKGAMRERALRTFGQASGPLRAVPA